MIRNPELDALKLSEQEAFHHKQEVFGKYQNAKARVSEVYEVMRTAWEKRKEARDELNHEYRELQRLSKIYREAWDEYEHIRGINSSRIELLRYESELEHRAMKDCFKHASSAYKFGNKSEAPIFSAEGRRHKEQRDKLNTEVKELIQEIRDAKANAEWHAPKIDSLAFHTAKKAFSRAKKRHESAQTEFICTKLIRDAYKTEFDSAHAEHLRLKEEFRLKLEEIKAASQNEKKNKT